MSQSGVGFLLPGGVFEGSMLALVALLLIGAGIWLFLNSRQTAAERERKRRLIVSRTGRMGDATIIDVRDCVLFYSYEVRGVAYTTSQDASELKNLLPPETSTLVGPTALKYSSNNPANSIVICEEWSGLRPPVPQFHELPLKESSHP
jgi:hypothetical protein